MNWRNLVSEVEPFGWILPGMTVESESLFYYGLICTVIAVRDEGTGKWYAHIKVAYPMLQPIEKDEEILNGQFWKNYADPFDTSEDAISKSLKLGKQLVDGEQVGMNDFLISKRTDQTLEELRQ